MKLMSQTEFTGIPFKEADNNMFEIYDEIPSRRFVLMKKGEVFGIQEYNPKTKKQGFWTSYSKKEIAENLFERVKINNLKLTAFLKT